MPTGAQVSQYCTTEKTVLCSLGGQMACHLYGKPMASLFLVGKVHSSVLCGMSKGHTFVEAASQGQYSGQQHSPASSFSTKVQSTKTSCFHDTAEGTVLDQTESPPSSDPVFDTV